MRDLANDGGTSSLIVFAASKGAVSVFTEIATNAGFNQ